MTEQGQGLTLDMFKDGLVSGLKGSEHAFFERNFKFHNLQLQFASLVHPPPTDVAHSDTASSESPEPPAQSNMENEETPNSGEEVSRDATATQLEKLFERFSSQKWKLNLTRIGKSKNVFLVFINSNFRTS